MIEDTSRSSLELLFDISRELARAQGLPEVLAQVLTLSVKNVGAERGMLVVLDESEVPVDAAIVVNGQLIPYTTFQLNPILDQGLAGWVLRQRQPALIDDTSRDDRWLRRDDDDRRHTGPKSAICMPIMTGSRPVGILTLVHPHPNFFQPHHIGLLQAIADQAGVAINNALLFSSLQTATRRYRELFKENINPLILTAWDGVILEANHAAASATGFSITELTGRSIGDLEHSSLLKISQRDTDLHNGDVVFYDGEVAGKDGKKFPAEIYAVCTNLNGQECLQWTVRDVTEKHELDHLREDLSAMIFHDLRAPLSNIVTSLDILKMLIERHEEETIWPVLDIARRSTDRMQRLIDSLLDISRLEANQPIVNRKITAIDNLVCEAVEVVKPVIESKNQKINLFINKPLPSLLIDTEMILRVVVNLLENANKFTPVGGELAVGTSSDSEQVTIWIQDSGAGIPKDEQKRIFEKFGRVHSNRFTKGVGLGLAFCRLAIQAHGGKIWVESNEGTGSRFILQLPLNNG